jgi:hypothetical protein
VIITRHSSHSPAWFATSAGATAKVVAAVTSTPAAAATESAASTATARPTPATGRFRLRLIHDNRAPVHLMLMEFLDRLLRGLVIRHFDEAESARASRGHVAHDPGTCDIANSAEERHQIFICGFVREIPNVQPATHGNRPPAEML